MKHRIIFNSLMVLLLFVSCNDFLNESPKSTISSNQFYKTADDAEAAVSAIYALLPDQFGNFQMTIATTDDGFSDSGAGAALVQAMWRYTFTPNNPRVFGGMWQKHYEIINRANVAIDKIPSIDMDENLKNSLEGEARFLRAFSYFKLVQFFGGVPLLTTPTESASGVNVKRATVDEVYEQITADFSFAENNLLDQASTEKGRASATAASGLLAKVYLTTKEWDKAAQKAKAIIDAGNNKLVNNFVDLFHSATEDNDETIFAYQYVAKSGFGYPSKVYLPRNKIPNWRGLGAFSSTQDLYDSYESNDLRREVTMFESYTTEDGQNLTFDHPWFRKFWDMTIDNTDDAGIDVPIVRYAEILLTYAEAVNEVNDGPTSDAYKAVNKVRRRAYGNDINSPSTADLQPGLSKAEFRKKVYHERRWELAGEYHRWFDLKRTDRLGSLVSAWLQNGKETNEGNATATFEKKHLLYPIPQSEIDANPKLEQNPGW